MVPNALLGGRDSARRGLARVGQGSQRRAQLWHGARDAPVVGRVTKDGLDGDDRNLVGRALPTPVG